MSEWDCGELYREIDAMNAIKVIATDLAAQVLADAERIRELEANLQWWKLETRRVTIQLDEMAGALHYQLHRNPWWSDGCSLCMKDKALLDNYDKEKANAANRD